MRDCPGDASGKEPTCHAVDIRDVGSIPGLRSFFRVGHGNPLWYSCWIKILEWTKKPGRLQSIGSHRVKHDWSDLALDSFVLWEWVIYGYPLWLSSESILKGRNFADQKMLNVINTVCASELFSSPFTLFSNYIVLVNYQISWIGLVEIYGKRT